MHVLEIIGWFGFVLYLGAYTLLAMNRIKAGTLYYILNILAALCIIAVSIYKGTVQAIVVNSLWGIISYIGITKYQIRNYVAITIPFRILILCLILLSIGFWLFGRVHWAIALSAWIYVLAFIISYMLFVSQKISVYEFHVWNFVAAMSILPELFVDNNWPVFALEIFWALAASLGIVKKLVLVKQNSQPG